MQTMAIRAARFDSHPIGLAGDMTPSKPVSEAASLRSYLDFPITAPLTSPAISRAMRTVFHRSVTTGFSFRTIGERGSG